ncbi:MAG: LPS assembly protein LptD [Pirellulaceae bacterium]
MGGRGVPGLLALTLLGLLLGVPDAPADIQLPVADVFAPIRIEGRRATCWQQNAVKVWVVKQCVIRQGAMSARGDEAVLWVDRAAPLSDRESRIRVYLEGSAAVDFQREGEVRPATGRAAQSIRDHSWSGRLVSRGPVDIQVEEVSTATESRPAIYERARAELFGGATGGPVRLAQSTAPSSRPTPPTQSLEAPADAGAAAGSPPPSSVAQSSGTRKRVQVGPRSNTLIDFESFPGSRPNQSVTVFSNGIRAVIEGLEAPELGHLGRVVIETDRLVLWGPNLKTLSPSSSEIESGGEIPIEVYMEGNIVFRQGDRLIYADRMYYNATHEYGVVLSAEVYTPMPDIRGMVRLKADVLQQVNKQFFQAQGAGLTTSQMGVPTYWLQSESIDFRDVTRPVVDPVTGALAIDERTNEAAVEHEMLATSRNNFLYMNGFPVLYWPVLATSLRKPVYYIERFSLKNDSMFGTQALADWDLFQLLTIQDPPAGTDWFLTTDYLSERGLGLGTTLEYDRNGLWGYSGPVSGRLDAWGLRDHGLDDLGRNRRSVQPEDEWRGRAYWRHRHYLPNGWRFTGQLGYITDRNFLEQYYEREWDEWKDRVTSLELKRSWNIQSLRVLGQVNLNESVSQTEWFPRLDHFLVGQSLLQDRLTWYAHSQAGYARFQTLDAPTDPQDLANWAYLPWDQPGQKPEGGRFATRQEVDWPLQWGAVKVVPYVAGELAHWQEGLNGTENVSRALGQAGVRASLPFWRSDPTVQSLLFNLNRLAHKVTLTADMFWADATEEISEFPLYDPLDDDSQEHFRRYMGVIPWRSDPRNFAFRSGIQRWVSSPTLEMADDLMAARLGIHQRWQTKRGLPGHERVTDWIVFDVDGTLFPDPDRDNFGEHLGQFQYDFRWHVGDRVSLLSDGYMDLFDEGFRRFSLGSALSRPGRAEVYGGIVSLEGPLSSTLLVGSTKYRLSPKWIAELSGTYDLGSAGNVDQRIGITRIGESVLVRLSAKVDHGRDNVGASIMLEPRFLPNGELGRVGGRPIPPAGAMGLE